MTDSTASTTSRPVAAGLTSGLFARSLAEFAGTLLAVMVVMVGAVFGSLNGSSYITSCLTAFFGYMAASLVFGRVSGGHFNPAVTLTAALSGRLKWLDALCYAIAQVLGGIAAAALMLPIFPVIIRAIGNANSQQLTKPTDALIWQLAIDHYGTTNGRITSDIQTALLVDFLASLVVIAVVIMGIRKDGSATRTSALTMGVGYAAGTVFTAMITGPGLNPAYSTGAAIFGQARGISDAMSQLWVFWIVPLLAGAVIGLILAICENVPSSGSQSGTTDTDDAEGSASHPVSSGKAKKAADTDDADDLAEASLKNAAHRVSMDQKAAGSDDERDIQDFNTVIRQDTADNAADLHAEKEASERNDSESDSDTNIDYLHKDDDAQ